MTVLSDVKMAKKSAATARPMLLLVCALALTACSHDAVHEHAGTATAASHDHSAATATVGGLFVSAAFSPDGRLWRAIPDKDHVLVDFSNDAGKTFSAPVSVNAEPQPIKASGENRPGILVDRTGRIHVIYAAEGNQPMTLYYSVSSDNGHSFSTPAPLSDKAAEATSFQGRLALSPNGEVYAFWHDERDRTDWKQLGNAGYYTKLTAPAGTGFVAHKLSDALCDCCRIAMAFDSDNQPVVMARFIYPGGIRDHGLIKPQAEGKPAVSWRVTFDEWAIEACPDHGPALSVSDDKYHIVWFTQGSVRQGVFYAVSSDHGQHFSTPLPLGNAGKLPSHPDVLAKGPQVVVTWTEFDGSKTELFVMQSNDGGQTWLPAKALAQSSAQADFPFLLNSGDKVFVSWNSKSEGYRLIPVN